MEKTIISYNQFHPVVQNTHFRVFDGNHNLFEQEYIQNDKVNKVFFIPKSNADLLKRYLKLVINNNYNFIPSILNYFKLKGKPINPKTPNLNNILITKVINELSNRLYTKQYLVNWLVDHLIEKQEKFIKENFSFYREEKITYEDFLNRLLSLPDVFEPTGNLANYLVNKIDLTELNMYYKNFDYLNKSENFINDTYKDHFEYKEMISSIYDTVDYNEKINIKSVSLNFNDNGTPYLSPLSNTPITGISHYGYIIYCTTPECMLDKVFNIFPNKPTLKKNLKSMTKFPSIVKDIKDGIAKIDLPGVHKLLLDSFEYTNFIETILVNFVNYLVIYIVSQYEHTSELIELEVDLTKSTILHLTIRLKPIDLVNDNDSKLLDKSSKYQLHATELKLFY